MKRIPACLFFILLTGCALNDPVTTVQTYLRMLSGESKVTYRSLEAITTEEYRTKKHPHLASITSEQREKASDLAEELKNDPAIREFLKRVKWVTTYEVRALTDSSVEVVARIIISERRPGDREKALSIEGLPSTLAEILRKGLEIPLRFQLVKQNGRWKIDDLNVPEILIPLLIKEETPH